MRTVGLRQVASGTLMLLALTNNGCGGDDDSATGPDLEPSTQFQTIELPAGYTIERVVAGLTFPTAIAWDDQGTLYVSEAGGGFVEEPFPSRILRVAGGQATELVNLEARGVQDAVAGMVFHNGAFLITHRDADRSGAVSRIGLDGSVTKLLTGFLDSQSEHQLNDIRVGPDGLLYLTNGPAANSGVVGLDLAPFISRSPGVRTTPCQDIVLTGRNYETPDFRTPGPTDLVRTGAYMPFGTPSTAGQVIPGTNKCGGAIFQFDPNNAEGTLRVFAHGFRNVLGIVWNSRGEMFAAVNGYDVRGSRPVNDEFDATYRVREGAWYGVPDYSAALEPLTEAKFNPPDALQASVFIGDAMQPKALGFVIDQAASGLAVPDQTLVVGLHEVNSSPSLLDVAPASWGAFADQLFVAEWGDLAPGTTPLRDGPAGFQVVRLTAGSTAPLPFLKNVSDGPASRQGATGMGIERPYAVRFGPDGAMYVVDWGIVNVNPEQENRPPYEFLPQTGAIWRVSPPAP